MIRHVDPIFEKSVPGRKGYSLPPLDIPEENLDSLLPEKFARTKKAELPEVSEVDVVRHSPASPSSTSVWTRGSTPSGRAP